jgi:RNA polymerase sigma factor (sigma-70 family)
MSSLSNSPFLSSKSFLNTIKYLKISFFILLVLGSIFKSLFLLGILKDNFVLKDLLLIAGIAGLAIIYIISSLNKKGVLIIAFNYLIALFLIGSLFFFSGYPGGKTMLYLSMGMIPLLILAISFGKKSENEFEINNLSTFEHPGVALENKENAQILFQTINELTENQKTAFILSKLDGLNNPEIAEIMNVSISSVESFIFRAKASLKEKLSTKFENYRKK